jgi:Zn-dependent M28 family amino/carboxypeptidase
VFNIDALSPTGKARDMTVVVMGSSELEDALKPVADAAGLRLHEESKPEAGGYFRSDHFNFAKAGVPALYIDSGEDLVDGGVNATTRVTRTALQNAASLAGRMLTTEAGVVEKPEENKAAGGAPGGMGGMGGMY